MLFPLSVEVSSIEKIKQSKCFNQKVFISRLLSQIQNRTLYFVHVHTGLHTKNGTEKTS